MPAIDWTDAFEKYRGKWVAFKSDHQTVIGSGDSLEAAERAANENGCTNPIVTRLPKTLRNFIGHAE